MEKFKVIFFPLFTEKSNRIAEKNSQVLFAVDPRSNKSDVKSAVKLLFGVDVVSVQMARVKGKVKRFGRSVGRRKQIKKAFVSLKPGQEISFDQEAGL